jgi:hypothetical protein
VIFPPPIELSLYAVADPGVPNKERIILRPTERVNLAQFGVLQAVKLRENYLVPLSDNFFWFGDIHVEPPSWIILWTGQGDTNLGEHPQTKQQVLSYFWGKKETMFNGPDVVPIVFQMSSILIGHHQGPKK